MQDLANRVPDDGIHHTVDVHALPDGRVRVGDNTFSAKEFADMLRRDPHFDGSKPIRLLSCDAGTSGLARDLANELGTPVTAPRGLAWTDGNGRVFASDMGPDGRPGWPPNGGWDTHHPDGTTTSASNDGFHPTRDGEDPGQRPEDAESRGRDLPSPRDIDWQEPRFDRTEDRTASTNSRSELLDQQEAHLRDPGNNPPPDLAPHTRYRIIDDPAPTDRPPRVTHLYSNGDTPPRITHVDAEIPNTEVERPSTNPDNTERRIGNPDANYLASDINYRVDTGEGHFTFRTNDQGRAVFDLDNFDAPPGRSSDAPTAPDADASGNHPASDSSASEDRADDGNADHTGEGSAAQQPVTEVPIHWDLHDDNGNVNPFSSRSSEENTPNTHYRVTTTDSDGNTQQHGDFYTDSNGDFSHIRTWSGVGTDTPNPELGDYQTMRDPTQQPGEGLPLTGVKYEVTNDGSTYHTNTDGNSAVSFSTDYSGEPNQPRGNTGVQTKTGRIGTYIEYPQSPDVEYRGGHGRDHANTPTPPNERINITPQIREQNDSVGDRNNWRQMEINRETLSANTGHSTEHEVRVWYDTNPNGGMVPVRTHVFWEQQLSGEWTAHYRSFVNVPSPAPPPVQPEPRRPAP